MNVVMPNEQNQGLAPLTEDACINLLALGYTGRLAFIAADGRPLILPVNYRLDADHRIVVRTTEGEKLEAARRGDLAAFEIDGIDEEYRSGWSVVVRGRLRDITDEGEDSRPEHPLRPWVRGASRDCWIRLEPDEISGRRVLP